jgi:hypothetical protein
MTADAQEGVAAPVTVNRDNYMHMGGESLRRYAHSLGVAKSEAARLSDDQLRHQCRMAISHQYED